VIQFQPDPPPTGVDPITAEWVRRQLVLLSHSTSAVTEVVTIEAGTTDQLAQDIAAVELDLAAHVANVADAHGIDNKLAWAGRWEAGAYKRNDMVNDSGWLAVANVDTVERPVTDVDWILPTVPAWVSSSIPGPLILGARFTLAAVTVTKRLRAWVNIGSTLSLVVDPLGISERQDFPVTGTGWVEVDLADLVLPAGTVIDLFLSVPGDPAPQDVIVNGWPTLHGFKQVGVYNPATVVLTRDQYGVDMAGATFSLDWDLVSWPG